jgi:hypothetical protein
MPDPLIESLTRKHRLAEWNEAQEGRAALLIWRFFFAGWEISEALPANSRERPATARRLVQATWQREAGHDALFTTDVFECSSREAALDTLTELLAQVQLDALQRVETMGVGDLCFADPDGGRNAIIFLRGNVVTRMLRADHGHIALDAAAADLDGLWTGTRPLPQAGLVEANREAPVLFNVRPVITARSVVSRSEIVLELLEAEPPLEMERANRVWYRLRTPQGKLSIESRRPVYRDVRGGSTSINAQAISSTGIAEQEIDVSPSEP